MGRGGLSLELQSFWHLRKRGVANFIGCSSAQGACLSTCDKVCVSLAGSQVFCAGVHSWGGGRREVHLNGIS